MHRPHRSQFRLLRLNVGGSAETRGDGARAVHDALCRRFGPVASHGRGSRSGPIRVAHLSHALERSICRRPPPPGTPSRRPGEGLVWCGHDTLSAARRAQAFARQPSPRRGPVRSKGVRVEGWRPPPPSPGTRFRAPLAREDAAITFPPPQGARPDAGHRVRRIGRPALAGAPRGGLPPGPCGCALHGLQAGGDLVAAPSWAFRRRPAGPGAVRGEREGPVAR